MTPILTVKDISVGNTQLYRIAKCKCTLENICSLKHKILTMDEPTKNKWFKKDEVSF